MIRIALLDKHKLFRVSIESFLEKSENTQVVLSTDSIDVLQSFQRNQNVDLIIADPKGLAEISEMAVKSILDLFHKTRVLFLTEQLNEATITSAIERDAFGYFSKSDDPSQLTDLLNQLNEGYYKHETQLGKVPREFLVDNNAEVAKNEGQFSSREIEILELVCLEKTNAEISSILGLSIRTVESHRRRMIDKMDCRNIIGVILGAINTKVLSTSIFSTVDPFALNRAIPA